MTKNRKLRRQMTKCLSVNLTRFFLTIFKFVIFCQDFFAPKFFVNNVLKITLSIWEKKLAYYKIAPFSAL